MASTLEIMTSVQITRKDRARVEALKVHKNQAAHEVLTKALDALEREQRSQERDEARLSPWAGREEAAGA